MEFMPAPDATPLAAPARVAAVFATGLLGAPPELAFDRLVRIAARLLDVPVAVIALVTDSRHVIVSQHGLGEPPAGTQHSLPLDLAPCRLVVETGEALVIHDIRTDQRSTSMCSIADAGIVAYAGVPLRAPDGTILGSFAVLGPTPRSWSDDDCGWLEQLSAAASNELALREATRRAEVVAETATSFAVSLEKKEREARAEFERQLHHAQKMEAVGTLAGGIAHDFNNMLVGILGNIEVALADHPAQDDGREALDGAREAALRARALVAQILDFSRGRPPERTPIRLWPVVEEAWRLARSMLPPTVTADAFVDDPGAMVHADPTQLHRVVMNLCNNAAAAMHGRAGRVVIRQELVDIGQSGYGTVEPVSPGSYLRLSVSDTGSGMDDETQRRMFEPFFTRRAKGGGTGLGLTMVHAIVKSHDGSLAVESQPDAGTTVHVYLPRLVATSAAPAITDAVPSEPDGQRVTHSGKRILVVDDEESVSRTLERMLRRLGHTATVFTSPSAALEWVRAEPGRVDAVITDL